MVPCSHKVFIVARQDGCDIWSCLMKRFLHFSTTRREEFKKLVPLGRTLAGFREMDILQIELNRKCRTDCGWHGQHLDAGLNFTAVEAAISGLRKLSAEPRRSFSGSPNNLNTPAV